MRFLRYIFLAISPVFSAPAVAQDDVAVLVLRAKGEVAALRDALTETEALLSKWEQEVILGERAVQSGAEIQDRLSQLQFQLSEAGYMKRLNGSCRNEMALLEQDGAGDTETIFSCISSITPTYELRERLDCSSLRWSVDVSGEVLLTGHVSKSDDFAYLQQRYGVETVRNVQEKPWPVCGAIKALEIPMTSADRPTLGMLGGSDTIKYDESLAFRVTTPNFFAFLYVAYLQADGSVVNLTPRNGIFRVQHPPNETLTFGDGRNGRQKFTASPPSGNEAIVVVASRSPIRELEQIESERDGQYRMAQGGSGVAPINQGEFIALLEKSLTDSPQNATGQREIGAEILHVTIMP